MGVGLINAYQMIVKFDLMTGADQVDIAEFSLWGQNGAGTTLSDSDAAFLAQNLADSWSANVHKTGWCTNVRLASGMIRCFNTSGHTIVEQEKAPTSGWTGTSSSYGLPWETSLCVSEYGYQPGTFDPQARRKRGRYYLPPMSSALLAPDNSGQIDPAQMVAIADDQIAFYNALFDGSGTSLIVEPRIFSRGAKSGGVLLPPDMFVVEYLSIDPVIDSQRRRRNKQVAARTTMAVG